MRGRTTPYGLITHLALALCLLAPIGKATAQGVEITGVREDFKKCRAIEAVEARVVCYDALQAKLEEPNFKGWHAAETPPFTISKPTLLRYQSDGPIFVMYLKDEKGDVVQNLHIGGGGESTFLVSKPGVYTLQVSGTDTWRIWLEPQVVKTSPHG